jgi:hypothetical protein
VQHGRQRRVSVGSKLWQREMQSRSFPEINLFGDRARKETTPREEYHRQ